MITGELKNKIDSLWDIFAAGGLVNPLDVIEQITYLMFIHDLDDTDNLRAKEAAMLGLPYQSIFADEVQVGDRTIDGQQLKWSVFHDFPAGKMYSVMQEWVFPFIKNLHGDKNSAYSKYMDDAIFKLPTPLLLSKVVDALDEIYRLMNESQAVDVRGDTYEYLLSKISQSGRNGQFRTPRHIIRLILKNFLSFDDEAQFDMFPNMKRTQLAGHVYTDLCDVPLLKQAAIYGSNGAGKSNVVKAMEFLRAFALNKDFAKNLELGKFFYLLKKDAGKEPISLAVEFEIQQHFFFYEVELTETFVAKEGLYESFPKEGKLDLIYERKQEEVEFAQAADDAIAEATRKMLEKNPLASLMALNREFPIIADARCALAAQWFNGQLEIIGVHTFLPTLIDLLRDNQPMMEFVRQLVSSLEVGVNDMTLQETDFDSWAKQHIAIAQNLPGDLDKVKSLSLNANTTPVLSINVENGVRKVYQLIFDNIGKGGFVGSLDTSMQSDGTLRALTLLPALYYACKQGKTVVVDEINCCLSPTMVKGIVEYFAKTADTNGQLIFTTHDNQLLDERDMLRSDEIWFVDKREGASVLYSHNDFKEHHTISPFRGYNEGRYGAIRFVNLLKDYAN